MPTTDNNYRLRIYAAKYSYFGWNILPSDVYVVSTVETVNVDYDAPDND